MKRDYIYIPVIFILLLLLWDCRCSSSLGEEIETTSPTMKGSVPFSDKGIVKTPIIKPEIRYIKGQIVYRTITDSIDHFIALEAVKIADSFKLANDSLKAQMFSDATTPYDFSKTIENDTIKINMFGKYRGELYGLGATWEIKPLKFKTNIKQYLLLAGIEAVSNKELSNNSIGAKVFYLSPNKTLYFSGYDINGNVSAGVAKKIFGFNREVKK